MNAGWNISSDKIKTTVTNAKKTFSDLQSKVATKAEIIGAKNSNAKTTMIYTHVAQRGALGAVSPLDHV